MERAGGASDLPPDLPDRFPAYLDRRVYAGSSGRVYPLPFHDRISETSTDHSWVGLHLENDYLRVLVLPELGGRIHYAIDRRTGYPLFYANPVIEPAPSVLPVRGSPAAWSSTGRNTIARRPSSPLPGSR